MSQIDDPKQFLRALFDFWNKRGVSNLKIPQIAGRELNLCHLYKAVCKRGGFNRVCNHKMWKEIVNEFALPPSCTSASFTLKNHYTKYLFAYEQKYFFGKDDADLADDNVGIKTRKMIKGDEGEEIRTQKNESAQPPIPTETLPSIKQVLQKIFEKRDPNEEVISIRKFKMTPTTAEINRATLAFESRLDSEVTFALNSLLLFSCSSGHLFLLDQYSLLFENMTKYFDDAIKKIPYMNKNKKYKYEPKKGTTVQKDKMETESVNKSSVIKGNNGNDESKEEEKKIEVGSTSQIVSTKTGSNIDNPNKEITEMVMKYYTIQNETGLFENIKVMMHIFRNLSYTKANDAPMVKNERLFGNLLELFINGVDPEITKCCLDIFTNLTRVINLKNFSDPKAFCYKLYEYLESSNQEEIEAAIECLKNMVVSQDNEPFLEDHAKDFLESLIKMLVSPVYEVRDSVLEFLCYFSDLSMGIRAAVAKHPKSIMRLVAILSSGIGKSNDRASKLAAIILSNLALSPTAKMHFQPFERDLFVIAATDEHVSKLVCNILAEIETDTLAIPLSIDM